MGRKTVFWAIAAGIVVVVMAMAWIKGGTKPMRWIEQPVSRPGQAS